MAELVLLAHPTSSGGRGGSRERKPVGGREWMCNGERPARFRRGRSPTLVALGANAEALDERAVAGDVLVAEVLEQTAALTDEEEQTTTRVVVMLMFPD